MTYKRFNAVAALKRFGVDNFDLYTTAHDMHASFTAWRPVGEVRLSKHMLIRALVNEWGFWDCGFMREGKRIYFNPHHPASNVADEDKVYPRYHDD